MKIHKDKEHSVSVTPFAWRGERFLMLSVGLYAAFDPEGGASRLRTEQDFWKEAPAVFAALGQTPLLDAGLLKPGAEVLLAGFCRTPGASPRPAQEVSFRVGSVKRRLAVFGDRERLPGGGLSDPLPFAAMPLIWEKAFGGPDFPANPLGRGLDKDNKTAEFPPNLEDPEHLLLAGTDRPAPVCPFPLDMANPARRALSGSYDQTWLDTRWPAYPDDCDPEFFHSAQAAQRLRPAPGESSFFKGDEEVEIIGMRHDYPHLRSRLPQARVRAFVRTTEQFVPFALPASEQKDKGKTRLPYAKDLDGPGLFREADLHLDTVWLLPDLLGAFVLYRGLLPVEDDELDDVLRVLVVTEKPSEAPQSLEYYREELRRRAYPAVEIDLAPFAAAQAQTSKAVKTARDVPKVFAKLKKDMTGQSPAMPLSLGDLAHSGGKTIATGRAVLDQVETQMLDLREQFSHLMSFDLSIFPRMRAALDAQEQNLHKTLADVQEKLRDSGEKVAKGLEGVKKNALARLAPALDADPGTKAAQAVLAGKIQAKLDGLDNFTPEGVAFSTPAINPWHDRGFKLLIAARRALRRNDALLARLAALGLEAKTLEDGWVGHAGAPIVDRPEAWGLPPNPAAPEFTLPAGLYLPRFAGKALVALRVYPLSEQGELRGLGLDNQAVFLAPGSDPSPLSLPAAHPGGAVCVAPEDLSALFAEQEAGDFCHIVAVADPAELAAVKDLPPLLPDAPGREGGLPLVVILPPGEAGNALFKAWRAAYPASIALQLPAGCPHALALAGQGRRLRRLLLDVLPPELARSHDFDIPLPPKDRPPEPFTLNLPLPGKEELQGRVAALIKDVRAHFPDPKQMLAGMIAEQRASILGKLEKMRLPPAMLAKVTAALDNPPPPPPWAKSVSDTTSAFLEKLKGLGAKLSPNLPPDMRAKILARLAEAEGKALDLGERLAPLDALRADGLAKLAGVKKGELPPEVQAAFDAEGMDSKAMQRMTREEVAAVLAADKNLERKNLQGLDLSDLDFSGARLGHALCGKTNFQNCRLDGADFTFTLAHEANFSGASLREAVFLQTVLQKAVLRKADLTSARMELTTCGECDLEGAVFDRAEIKLCNFSKALLTDTRFSETLLSLCAFSQIKAAGADFRAMRGFKCLFQKSELARARFQEAVLSECLFQGAEAAGASFAGGDLRKFYTDAETDLSEADFSGADMREASLRMSRFCGADFYRANLENALLVSCDLSRARLDGLRASGCRFIKCDLTRADISGANLLSGALRKCRLSGADMTEASLYAVDLRGLTIDRDTRFDGVNFKKTRVAGKEEALRELARRNS